MRKKRLKTIVRSQALVILLWSCLLPMWCGAEEITPDRSISVVQSSPQSPEWKTLWDAARKFVKDNELQKAASVYSELFRIKPNIEQAAWEYCKVLLSIDDFEGVAKMATLLLEGDPDRSEYQLVAGKVALHRQDYLQAISHFGRVFEQDPTGEYSSAAISGLAESLKKRGRREESFLFFEQLLARKSENKKTLREMAVDAVSLGKSRKAKYLFSQLLERQIVDDEVLLLALDVFNEPGNGKIQEKILTEFLSRHPDSYTHRKQLVELLEKRQDYTALLEQLSMLLEFSQGYNTQEALLQAADIALEKLNRPDRALLYLEQYNQKYPDNLEVEKLIDTVQISLAKDLLAITENEGAILLWQDLAALGSSRMAIFEKMADILLGLKKHEPLIDVLDIIYKNSNDSTKKSSTALLLAQELQIINEPMKGLQYLKEITRIHRNKKYFFLRAELEEVLGMEVEALANFEKSLRFDPGDNSLRRKCLELAGQLGLVGKQIELFGYWKEQPEPLVDIETVLLHLRLLGYNYLGYEASKVEQWAGNHFRSSPQDVVRLGIESAKVLQRVGKGRKAAQKLRTLLNNRIWVDLIIFELTELALDERNIYNAEQWIDILEKQRFEGTLAYQANVYLPWIRLVRAKMHRLNGEYADAANDIRNASKEITELATTVVEKNGLERRLKIENTLLRLATKSSQYILQLENDPHVSFQGPEQFVLDRMVVEKEKEKDRLEKQLYVDTRPVLSRILAVAESEFQHGEYKAANKHLEIVTKYLNDSLLCRVLGSHLEAAAGKKTKSRAIIAEIGQGFSHEPYFCEKNGQLAMEQGDYDATFEHIRTCYDIDEEDTAAIANHLIIAHEDGTALKLARLLWAKREHKKALRLYEKILSPSIMAILTQQFSEKKINYREFRKDESFWGSMMQLIQSEPELVDEIMKPLFLVTNIGNNTGRIVADNYEKYSWQQLIRSEFQAREATYERNYTFAEQRYRKLLEQEKTTEAMVDLAGIYSRIGEYRKEAQLYDDIKTRGKALPELSDSIERSNLRIQPQNIIDGSFTKKDGRDGYVDLEQTKAGTSFWFIHDFNKDFRFSYSNNTYKSVDGSQKTGSNVVDVQTNWELNQNYEITAGVGVEKLNGESYTNLLYTLHLDGQLDDNVAGFVAIEERLVTDTVASIVEHIKGRSITMGLEFDTSFGLEFGADLLFRRYSDDNQRNQFHCFTSYTIFGESIRLDFRYDYSYLNSDKVNSITASDSNENTTDFIDNYWSPDEYMDHTFGMHFQHDFLGYEDEGDRKMSYYSLDGSIGIDDNETLVYSTNFDIFLEMNPHFLLKGNFSLSTSNDYEETGMSVSLYYRW